MSATESKHVSLSAAIREAICLQQMIREMRKHSLEFEDTQRKVHCKTFKDDSGALDMANDHKLRPRTEHLAVSCIIFVIVSKTETSLSHLSAQMTSSLIA